MIARAIAAAVVAAGLALTGAPASAQAGVESTRLADLAWLEGSWSGAGPAGSTAEVHYMAPRANVLASLFRLRTENRVVVLEAITFVETDDGILLYVRHFTPELVPLEAERALALRLTARDGDRFTFENLYDENPRSTDIERTGSDTFRAWSVLLRPDGTTDEIRVEYRRERGG